MIFHLNNIFFFSRNFCHFRKTFDKTWTKILIFNFQFNNYPLTTDFYKLITLPWSTHFMYHFDWIEEGKHAVMLDVTIWSNILEWFFGTIHKTLTLFLLFKKRETTNYRMRVMPWKHKSTWYLFVFEQIFQRTTVLMK